MREGHRIARGWPFTKLFLAINSAPTYSLCVARVRVCYLKTIHASVLFMGSLHVSASYLIS